MLRFATTTILAISLLGGASLQEAWHMWRGEDAYNERQYPQAAAAYAEGWESGEGASQSRIAYNEGDSLYRAQEWVAAEKAFARAITAQPQNWRALYNQGNAQVQQGYVEGQITDRPKLETAVATYEAALKIQPEDEDTLHNLAWLKKLLEEDEQKQEPQKPQDEQEKDKQKPEESQGTEQEQEQDDANDGDQDKDEQDQQSDSEQSDKGDEQDAQDQGGPGDQEQEQIAQATPKPDLSYSEHKLDQLAQEEARNQHYRSMQQSEMGDDPLDQLFEQLMQDPSSLFFGGGARRRDQPNDGIDW